MALLQRSWAHACMAKATTRPAPAGTPSISVDGPDPDRVLVIGAGPAAGAGMPDHDTALPGQLARALRDRTGRGATVESRGRHLALLEHLPDLVAEANLTRFDVLVVFVGLEDGATGVSARRWRRDLLAFIDQLQQDGARDTLALLTHIPPASSVRIYTGPRAMLADRRITHLNRIIDRIARDRTDVVRAELPPAQPDGPPGSPQWYQRCAHALAENLQPLLDARVHESVR